MAFYFVFIHRKQKNCRFSGRGPRPLKGCRWMLLSTSLFYLHIRKIYLLNLTPSEDLVSKPTTCTCSLLRECKMLNNLCVTAWEYIVHFSTLRLLKTNFCCLIPQKTESNPPLSFSFELGVLSPTVKIPRYSMIKDNLFV